MSLVNGSIDNLISGVSQQTPAMRLPNQADICDNFYPSLVGGLVKRPPTKTIKKVSADRKNAKLHIINRDRDNRYLSLIESGAIKVYELNGNEKTVSMTQSGTQYLAGVTPANIGALSIADYTFIFNKTRVVGYSDASTYHLTNGHLVYLKSVSYDTTYSLSLDVWINGTWWPLSASYTTPKNVGTVEEPPGQISSTQVLDELKSQLTRSPDVNPHISLTRFENVLYIGAVSVATTRVDLKASDSRSNTELKHVNQRVQRFSDLPARAVNNYFVEVTGDDSSSFDNYYVKFTTDNGAFTGPGTWQETVARNKAATLNAHSMPHSLIRQSSSSFTFGPTSWTPRSAGDEDSAPVPLFNNRTISEMFLYRNRLGILSDDNLTTTRAGDMFAFFPESAMTVTDADPISISAGHETVANLKYAVPFQDSLIVFSDAVQFNLTAPDIFSPETAALKVTTSYEMNTNVRPINSGSTIYFCVGQGENTGVREFYVDADTGNAVANVTAHVPHYLTRNPKILTGSTTSEILAAVTETEPHVIYMYKYYWSGGEKLQAAWHRFILTEGDEIIDAGFLESTLYILVYRKDDGTYLEKIDFDDAEISTRIAAGKEILPHIDRLAVPQSLTTDYDNRRITVALPYAIRPDDRAILVHRETHKAYEVKRQSATTGVIEDADFYGNAGDYYVGLLYDATYQFSQQFVRFKSSGSNLSTQMGRLQYRQWFLNYSHSSYFDVFVRHHHGTEFNYRFAGKPLGKYDLRLGKGYIDKGVFTIPVRSVSDRVDVILRNDTHYPSTFLSVEWEGDYTVRSRRL